MQQQLDKADLLQIAKEQAQPRGENASDLVTKLTGSVDGSKAALRAELGELNALIKEEDEQYIIDLHKNRKKAIVTLLYAA